MKKNSSGKIKKSPVSNASDGKSVTATLVKNFPTILKLTGAIMVAIFSIVLWKKSSSVIKNLVNANPEVLKDAIFGDVPHVFYCDRGLQSEVIPTQFTELNAIKGSSMGFASVNCSQLLPSGKSLYDRFKLKKEIRPTIFATAPWSKPQQAGVTYLKESGGLKKFVETVMAPKGTEVYSDKDLTKYCGFKKVVASDDGEISETCVVLLKGARFGKAHAELEKKLVLQYPRLKIAAVDAGKRRLSFEDLDAHPADSFALKLHALRNGTHYLSMVNPATWDYVSTFVSHALGAPLESYSEGDEEGPLRLVKATSASEMAAEAEKKAAKREKAAKKKQANAEKSAKRQAEARIAEEVMAEAKRAADAAAPSVPPVDPAEAERLRVEKERLRREQMERQERAQLFEEEADDVDAEEDEDSDSGEEAVIEL